VTEETNRKLLQLGGHLTIATAIVVGSALSGAPTHEPARRREELGKIRYEQQHTMDRLIYTAMKNPSYTIEDIALVRRELPVRQRAIERLQNLERIADEEAKEEERQANNHLLLGFGLSMLYWGTTTYAVLRKPK
jgi:hypothetical protein